MIEANDNIIFYYKGRNIDMSRPVKLYRNLTKKGNWYSLVQDRLTVAHTSAICLKDCTFIVNERTRQRVIKNKKKEFHAYIEGIIVSNGCGTTAAKNDLPAHIKYDPYKYDSFICPNLTMAPIRVTHARFVICNNEGVKAAYIF